MSRRARGDHHRTRRTPDGLLQGGRPLQLITMARGGFPLSVGSPCCNADSNEPQWGRSSPFDNGEMIINRAGLAQEFGVQPVAINVDDHRAELVQAPSAA